MLNAASGRRKDADPPLRKRRRRQYGIGDALGAERRATRAMIEQRDRAIADLDLRVAAQQVTIDRLTRTIDALARSTDQREGVATWCRWSVAMPDIVVGSILHPVDEYDAGRPQLNCEAAAILARIMASPIDMSVPVGAGPAARTKSHRWSPTPRTSRHLSRPLLTRTRGGFRACQRPGGT